MAGEKWISDLNPKGPLAAAARRVLMVRLEAVRDFLPHAVHESEKDVEYVHQLRVSTRRARAALDIFSLCLPDKVYELARKQLRRIRRAAGEARDWDVFLANLDSWGRRQKAGARRGLDVLIGCALGHRLVAQRDLEELGEDYPDFRDRFLPETIAAVHRPAPTQPRTLLALARPRLTDLIKELDLAAGRDLLDYEHLHQVRIIGKRLRYAMEVFADCFAPAFKEQLYPAVEEMQDILGAANDSHVACQRLETLRAQLRARLPSEWKRYQAGVDALLKTHQERLPQERKRFEEWWSRWQQSGGETALVGLIKSPA
jgi:CHAD domain-containing protein